MTQETKEERDLRNYREREAEKNRLYQQSIDAQRKRDEEKRRKRG